jgi:hypothetical protein
MISDPLSDLVSGVVSELKDPRVPDFASVVKLYTSMDGPLSAQDAEMRATAREWLQASLAADLDVLLPTDLGDI